MALQNVHVRYYRSITSLVAAYNSLQMAENFLVITREVQEVVSKLIVVYLSDLAVLVVINLRVRVALGFPLPLQGYVLIVSVPLSGDVVLPMDLQDYDFVVSRADTSG